MFDRMTIREASTGEPDWYDHGGEIQAAHLTAMLEEQEWRESDRRVGERPQPLEGEAIVCQWFVLCDRTATVAVDHPILGSVPACDRCAARAGQGVAT